MKKRYFTLLCLLVSLSATSQTYIPEQFASSVITYSSQYDNGNYSAAQILGAPDIWPSCAGPKAWSMAQENNGMQFIEVGFANPQPVNLVRVYQTRGAGGVESIKLRNAATGAWTEVYSATAAPDSCGIRLEVAIATTPYNVDALRLDIDTDITEWQEFDAVSILNVDHMNFEWRQYASSVISFSSRYSTGADAWGPEEATGPPNVSSYRERSPAYVGCDDDRLAWASATADGQREFLELAFAYPATANQVRIFQNYVPGAVDTVYVRNAQTGTWVKVFETTAVPPPSPCRGVILEINFTETPFLVDAVRIALNSPQVPDWNEIDAVELRSNLPGNALFTVKSGNWNDPAVWSAGRLPAATDTVVIGFGHNLAVNAPAVAKSLLISSGGTLTANSANTLTIGAAGGDKEILHVQGTFNQSAGTVIMNGHVVFEANSSFIMSGGELQVDGNNGTSAGSVANGLHLFVLNTGMTAVNFTGGTLTFVDPQFHATGQSITAPITYVFGNGSTVRFGNGASTTGGNNVNGFGGPATYPEFGNLVMDATTATGNRFFKNENWITVNGNLTVTSGELRPTDQIIVKGSLTNNAAIVKEGGDVLRVDMDIVNNGIFSVTGGQVSVLRDFLNNATGVYNVSSPTFYTSIGDDLVNNGSFTTGWLYFANNFNLSVNEQSLGGTGTFNIYGLDINNDHANGVSLQLPLLVKQIYFDSGKLFIGNNDLRLQEHAGGDPNRGNYVVLNGSGRLIIENITVAPKIFPVGTPESYTPLTIANGSGHTFSVHVRNTFTAPPLNTMVVQKEWNITDMTGGAVSATLTFQWNATDENPGFNRAACYVGRYNGSAWHAVSPYGPAAGSDPYLRQVSGISAFSPFSVGSNGSFGEALPLRLTEFTVSRQNSRVLLQWTSENEVDVAHFSVERSADARAYVAVAQVPARNGARQVYTSVDPVSSGVYYYRLKMVDLDGKFTYSPVAKIDLGRKYTVAVYPNPVGDRLHIQGMQHYTTVEVTDAAGRIVLRQQVTDQMRYLDVRQLQQGAYFIRLKRDDDSQVLPFLKQ